ncbi:protein FAM185A-like [Lineus longissimus]|uniref:protein FAM185A-like n=1 Tax=Lineus longissimus TaxID=88925 RepID=UPI002B4E875C
MLRTCGNGLVAQLCQYKSKQQAIKCFYHLKNFAQVWGIGRPSRLQHHVTVRTAPYMCTTAPGVKSGRGLSRNTSLGTERHRFEEQELNVHPFGSLKLSTSHHIKIASANAQKYPEMDRLMCFADEPGVAIKFASDGKELLASIDEKSANDKVSTDALVNFQVPIKFGLQITAEENAKILISRVESDVINISSDKGPCLLQNVKCGTLNLTKNKGIISSTNLLQGNSNLALTEGDITADKLQGQNVNIRIEKGDATIQSLYTDMSTFSVKEGNLNIKNCHGKTRVSIEHGDLTIDSLDGDIAALVQNGNIKVHVMRHQNVDLETKTGLISLTIDPELESSFEVTAETVTLSDSITMHDEKGSDDKKLTGFVHKPSEKVIKLKAPAVDISSQDWLSALKFR